MRRALSSHNLTSEFNYDGTHFIFTHTPDFGNCMSYCLVSFLLSPVLIKEAIYLLCQSLYFTTLYIQLSETVLRVVVIHCSGLILVNILVVDRVGLFINNLSTAIAEWWNALGVCKYYSQLYTLHDLLCLFQWYKAPIHCSIQVSPNDLREYIVGCNNI